ncbi:MAG: ABC transporter permease [Parvularculaceae bacterium]|nr:ABC transporter permease [Parvularculaceae bacterium]
MTKAVYKNTITGSDGRAVVLGWAEHRHLLLHLVASDLRSRYRRTAFGVLWAVLWPVAFSLIFSMVAVNVFDTPLSAYVAYVVTGFIIWDFIAGCINGGTVSFQQAEGYLRHKRLPLILFPLRTSCYYAVNFAFGSVASILVIAAVSPHSFGWTWAWWPFSLAATFFFATPLVVISAIANLKLRDYAYGVSLIVFMLWYLSPVLIAREVYDKGALKKFTDLNPFASLIDIYRDIMLNGRHPEMHDVILVLGGGAVLWALALLWLRSEGRRLIYYL